VGADNTAAFAESTPHAATANAPLALKAFLFKCFPKAMRGRIAPVTFEQIASFKKSQREKTLGQLVKKLRKRTPGLDSQFEPFLTSFVEDRNRFVHELFTERNYKIDNPENVSKILEFVESLTNRSFAVLMVFEWLVEHLAERKFVAAPDSFKWPPGLEDRRKPSMKVC
jgi:hypothetical protein